MGALRKPVRTRAEYTDEILRLEQVATFTERKLLAGSLVLDYNAVVALKREIHELRTRANGLRRKYQKNFDDAPELPRAANG